MIRLRLIKGYSYTGVVSATKKQPFVDVETEAEAQAAVATGYFEVCASTPAEPPSGDDGAEGDSVPDYEGLSEMTKDELTAYAKENNISLDGCKTKADILEAISVANGGSVTMMGLQSE